MSVGYRKLNLSVECPLAILSEGKANEGGRKNGYANLEMTKKKETNKTRAGRD